MSKMMQAAQITHYHQPQPQIMTIPRPTMGPDDVLVKIQAASVNPIDIKTKNGGLRMLLKYDMPLTLGNDFAGEVVAVGAAVQQFQVGDAVYGRPQKNRIGTFAEYIAVAASDLALRPTNLTVAQAAAIPLVGLTSYQALHDVLALQPGQKVLIQAGAGGVGTIAIQIAKQLGAFVATTTSARNFDLVRQLGADQVIDYHTTDFSQVLHHYDAVFDTLGGSSLEQAFKIVKPGGRIVSVSGLPNERFAKAYGLPHWKQVAFRLASRRLMQLEKQTGVDYEFLFMRPSGDQLALLTKMIEAEKLSPIVDKLFPLSEIAAAFNYSHAGKAHGKIIIEMPE
ncbi:NADPH:quinone reductase [Lactiplantibacillus fabifermentans T30PCM01]|uniref:NADPH:quinone reductase n=1 Tax=Lactiplantibacillus fabifermentans T30PCM01 TaxID=1400520 RepID=W6T5R3_9LACO|nr:NADP-dependent oxidoreductase [Lactiplantibacillus fabifermentans]ETY73329.1 NADPH:quinone reductase [Lactiplantibacillus fabifermentans T30PCM01]